MYVVHLSTLQTAAAAAVKKYGLHLQDQLIAAVPVYERASISRVLKWTPKRLWKPKVLVVLSVD